MSYASECGLKVGDKIRLECDEHFIYKKGQILTLTEDDGTNSPYFEDNFGREGAVDIRIRKWEKLEDSSKLSVSNKSHALSESEYSVYQKLLKMFVHSNPDRFSDTYFICGESDAKGVDGLPDTVLICRAMGVDQAVVYKRVDNTQE